MIENPPLTSFTGMTGVCGMFLSSAFCFALVPLGNSSGADTRSSSNGMGCTRLNQTRHRENDGGTHATVDLVLVRFALLLDHEERMVEEEDDELGAVALPAAPPPRAK